jgi:hypothetical protein
MVSNDSAHTSPSSGAKATSAASVPPLDPSSPIEVASGGSSPINDPVVKDIKPPEADGDTDLSYLI